MSIRSQLAAATLTRVSQLAGCSKATASVVLNGAKGNISVGPDLRRKVQDVAEQLGYRPNHASRSLALQRTQTLGIYIPPVPWAGIGAQYEGSMLRGAETTCMEHGYQLLLLNIAGSARPELCVNTLVESRIDGLLLLRVNGNEPWINELTDRTDALVAIDCTWPSDKLDAVMFDTRRAIDLAIEHLMELGHRRIGYVGRCVDHRVAHNEARKTAYFKAMSELGIEPDPRWVFDRGMRSDTSRKPGGRAAADYFLSLGDQAPTAVVAYNDHMAAAMVQRLLERGCRLPEQLSVLTFEDTHLCRYLTPQLTSLKHPLEQMGRLAAERLIARTRHRTQAGDAPDDQQRIQWCTATLKVRASTAIHQD